MKYDLILLAGGTGSRMNLGFNKVLYKINGKKEIYKYSLDAFKKDESLDNIIIVANKNDYDYFKENTLGSGIFITTGGDTRSDSVREGLKLVKSEYVMIHDAARPMINVSDIYALFNEMKNADGATLVNKMINTVCTTDLEYLDRSNLVSVITPQCFRVDVLIDSYKKLSGLSLSDDTQVFKKTGKKVSLVYTDNLSIKATTRGDLKLLEEVLK